MGVWLGPMAKAAKGLRFEIPGATEGIDYFYTEETVDGVTYFELAIPKNLTVRILKAALVRLCLVAGGMPGGAAGSTNGGTGGAGGEVLQPANEVTLSPGDYPVVIGGSGENSSFNGLTARTGYGASGGSGAQAYSSWDGAYVETVSASGGGSGTLPFASGAGQSLNFKGRRFGNGGSGGGCTCETPYREDVAGAGGVYGSGHGVDKDHTTGNSGINGTDGTGSGGGGRYNYSTKTTVGGSGMLLIQGRM